LPPSQQTENKHMLQWLRKEKKTKNDWMTLLVNKITEMTKRTNSSTNRKIVVVGGVT